MPPEQQAMAEGAAENHATVRNHSHGRTGAIDPDALEDNCCSNYAAATVDRGITRSDVTRFLTGCHGRFKLSEPATTGRRLSRTSSPA
jgi:hypothetical protein